VDSPYFFIAILIYGLIFGLITYLIAIHKGQPGSYFWAGFGLGIIGVILVAFLPKVEPDTCPQCNQLIEHGIHYCPHCGAEIVWEMVGDLKKERIESATCPECNKEIEPGCRFCKHCGIELEWNV